QFFVVRCRDHRALPSFPTRRSSDLYPEGVEDLLELPLGREGGVVADFLALDRLNGLVEPRPHLIAAVGLAAGDLGQLQDVEALGQWRERVGVGRLDALPHFLAELDSHYGSCRA